MKLKQVFFVLLSLIMLSTVYTAKVNAHHIFQDIKSTDEAHDEIEYIFNKGIIKGYDSTNGSLYKPSNNVTRSQAAKMLVIATGFQPVKVNSSFPDVKTGTEASGYIEKAVQLGYFGGYADGTFGVNDPLTRGQMSAILVNAFKLDVQKWAAYPNVFKDVTSKNANISNIKAIYYNGITRGDGDMFLSGNSVTRSHFALFLARAMDDRFKVDGDVNGINLPDLSLAIGMVKVTDDELNVRTSPTMGDNKIGEVNTTDKLYVFDVQGDWLQIGYKNELAYIHKGFTKFLDADGNVIGNEIKKVKVTATELNARRLPSASSKVVGVLKKDEIISVYGSKDNWYLTTINGVPAYVSQTYTTDSLVTTPPPVTTPPVVSNLTGKVTVDGLNIRSGPSASYATIAKVNRGAMVTVKSINGFWAKVVYNGKEGYTHKTYLKLLNNPSSVKNRIIVIDAGHGYTDPGAGVKEDGNLYREKEITLNVALLVEKKLKAAGAKVVMTRSSDTFPSLQDRVDIAINNYAELFVSIHANANDNPAAKGTETYYNVTMNDNSLESYYLASKINTQIVVNADMNNRGVKEQAFFVNRNMDIPSVLVEMGFMTNPQDLSKLTSPAYVEKFATSIYNGIVQYYSAP
ncbi:N-acetylmuramoyl-L-alanine amidase [Paenisporosarcina quisquiliarum]|uniref:N-acetylmuramoyl-L-alanine amidase n=1 Tax=Paenisporosarcina quisquiliarum TaxID=365346 RepID=UPI003734EE95